MFGLSTVIGPLVGGFIVESVSWRWMFYVNLPIALLALVVINMGFKPDHRPRQVPIDYAGAALLAAALTCAILSISFSPTLLTDMPLGLAAIAVVGCLSLVGFLYVETAVAEPLLPLSLFRNRNFVLAIAICAIVSLALFGALTLMPMYFQVVKGLDPMSAGLHMAPVMLGMFLTCIISGQIISGVGRYKMFPVVGMALIAVALALLSQTAVATPPWLASLHLLLLGAGAGMVTLNLVTVVHNAVAHEHLGVATSGTMLFRSIGGSIGAALLGGIFAHEREASLAHYMPFLSSRNPSDLAALQEPARAMYLAIFVGALNPGFIAAAALALVAFVMALAIKEVPLRASIAADAEAECST